MMNNINFPIYGTIILLSLIISLFYIVVSIKEKNYLIIYFYIVTYITSSIIFGIIFNIIINNKIELGLSSYGCALGVLLTALIFKKYIKDIQSITIKSLPLTYAIGKIACLLSGCCIGIPYKGILSITYTKYNLEVFPIQLLETIVFLIIFILFNKKKNIEYKLLITCIISKFILDFLRYEHINTLITKNQIMLIVLLIILLLYKNKEFILKKK